MNTRTITFVSSELFAVTVDLDELSLPADVNPDDPAELFRYCDRAGVWDTPFSHPLEIVEYATEHRFSHASAKQAPSDADTPGRLS